MILRILFGAFFLISLVITLPVSAETQNCKIDKPIDAKLDPITIATGPLNGVYYPIGTSICQFAYVSDLNARCAALPTQGSKENLDRLIAGDVDLAIVQPDVLLKRNCANTFDEVELHPEYFHFLVRGKRGPKDESEDEEMRIYAGKEDSGHRATAERVLEALDLTKSKFQDQENPKYSLGERLCGVAGDENLDAILLTIGTGAELLRKIDKDCDCVASRHLSAEQLDILVEDQKVSTKAELPTRFTNGEDCVDASNQPEGASGKDNTFKMNAILVRRKNDVGTDELWAKINNPALEFGDYISPFSVLKEE